MGTPEIRASPGDTNVSTQQHRRCCRTKSISRSWGSASVAEAIVVVEEDNCPRLLPLCALMVLMAGEDPSEWEPRSGTPRSASARPARPTKTVGEAGLTAGVSWRSSDLEYRAAMSTVASSVAD